MGHAIGLKTLSLLLFYRERELGLGGVHGSREA